MPISSGLFSLLKFLSKIEDEKCESGRLIVFFGEIKLIFAGQRNSILNG